MNIKFFNEIEENDAVGGKGASLAKMYKNNFNIPNGYVIMTDVFNEFLVKNKIQKIIQRCDINDEIEIEQSSKEIMQLISKCSISDNIKNEIIKYYKELKCKYVAVRSSMTSEDGKSHAWAGQLETFLNVDETNLIECVKKCWSSIFSPRAISYRIKNNDTSDISVAVVVQKMVQSEVSGVAFSINPTNNNSNEIIIEGVLGLGDAIVSGKITPDTYIIDKNNYNIKNKKIKIQKSKLIKINGSNKLIDISEGNEQKLKDEMILKLSKLIKEIEEFYNFPVDVEWAIEKKEIYILQSRPVTTVIRNELVETIKKKRKLEFLCFKEI